jgi:predicted RNase H-like HicB family nuclease
MTEHAQQGHYSMVIQWSDEDQAYLVTLPDWASTVLQPVTHGDSYAEAACNGQEVLDMLIEEARSKGQPLPPVQALRPA